MYLKHLIAAFAYCKSLTTSSLALSAFLKKPTSIVTSGVDAISLVHHSLSSSKSKTGCHLRSICSAGDCSPALVLCGSGHSCVKNILLKGFSESRELVTMSLEPIPDGPSGVSSGCLRPRSVVTRRRSVWEYFLRKSRRYISKSAWC